MCVVFSDRTDKRTSVHLSGGIGSDRIGEISGRDIPCKGRFDSIKFDLLEADSLMID